MEDAGILVEASSGLPCHMDPETAGSWGVVSRLATGGGAGHCRGKAAVVGIPFLGSHFGLSLVNSGHGRTKYKAGCGSKPMGYHFGVGAPPIC